MSPEQNSRVSDAEARLDSQVLKKKETRRIKAESILRSHYTGWASILALILSILLAEYCLMDFVAPQSVKSLLFGLSVGLAGALVEIFRLSRRLNAAVELLELHSHVGCSKDVHYDKSDRLD